MSRIQNDLPVSLYVLAAMLVVGHEALGARSALLLAAAASAAWLVLSLLLMMVVTIRKAARETVPPK